VIEKATSRRDFLVAAGVGWAALAWPRLATGGVSTVGDPLRAQRGFSAFVSEPSLRPPSVSVSRTGTPAPGFLFATTLNGPGQRGPLILDNRGQVVWFRPTAVVVVDFRAQVYRDQRVLSWWEGEISDIGVGEGEGVILDQTYKEVARVRAGNGYKADVHEFLLTPRATAILTIYNAVPADLSNLGGETSGNVLDSIVQEVDVRTGQVLFEWHSLDHVPLSHSYAPVLEPFDYFHINSVDVDRDGNLLVSARNTSAVYKIDRATGRVLWRLGGRSSDFQVAPEAAFMYQHDARAQSDGTITLFDNGPSFAERESRAIRLGLDFETMRADLRQQWAHPAQRESVAMGNAQLLAGGSVLVGWGTAPSFTEFGPRGNVRLDGTFDGGAWNYRTYRSHWTGRPSRKPRVVARARRGAVMVYASWNGATETSYWRVLSGDARTRLQAAKTVRRTGFETSARLAGRHRFVAVTALDRKRRPIGSSRVVAVRT